MKLIKYFQIVTLIFLVFSCSSDDGNMDNNINNRTSSCNNVLGYTGLYWDFANGLPTGLSQVPIIQNPGQQFIHNLQPLLGFTLPQGYIISPWVLN